MTTKERTTKRYRLSVPEADASVNDWIAKQDNLSFSLRCIIKEAIARHGMTDVTCVGVAKEPIVAVSCEPERKSEPVAEQQIPSETAETAETVEKPVLISVEPKSEQKRPLLSQTPTDMQSTAKDALASLLK